MTESEYQEAKIRKTLELVQMSLANFQIAFDDLKDARTRLIGLIDRYDNPARHGIKDLNDLSQPNILQHVPTKTSASSEGLDE